MNRSSASEAPASEDNSKLRTLKLKKAIVPKAGSAVSSNLNQPASAPSGPPAQLISAIESARSFKDLPSPYSNPAMIKQFRMTCYSAWTASSEMFDGFTVDSKVLLGIVQASFAATWPNSLYVPQQQDIFHQTVSKDMYADNEITLKFFYLDLQQFTDEPLTYCANGNSNGRNLCLRDDKG
jgi:hypothetical protein